MLGSFYFHLSCQELVLFYSTYYTLSTLRILALDPVTQAPIQSLHVTLCIASTNRSSYSEPMKPFCRLCDDRLVIGYLTLVVIVGLIVAPPSPTPPQVLLVLVIHL